MEDIRVTDKSADPSPRGGTPRTYVSGSDSDSGGDEERKGKVEEGNGKGEEHNGKGEEHNGGRLFLRF